MIYKCCQLFPVQVKYTTAVSSLDEVHNGLQMLPAVPSLGKVHNDNGDDSESEQHAPEQDELVLAGAPLDEADGGVGQAQGVGHVYDPAVGPLQGVFLVTETCENVGTCKYKYFLL